MATFDFAQLAALWTQAGGDPPEQTTAAAIALAESQGNSAAIDNTAYPNLPGYHVPRAGAQKEYSVGLWQINLLAHPQYTEAAMLDPKQNATAAVFIAQAGLDFTPWSTYTSGTYKYYIPGGVTTGPTQTIGTEPLSGAGPGTSTHQVEQAWLRLMRIFDKAQKEQIPAVRAARARIRNAVK